MRSITRPTTPQRTLAQYMGFLISEPKSSTCTRLSELTGTCRPLLVWQTSPLSLTEYALQWIESKGLFQ